MKTPRSNPRRCLVVSVGGQVRRVVPIADGGLTIGRGSENELVIDDNHVSRRHARLTVQRDRVWIEDLKSANGTYVNGSPVDRHALGPGDTIELGPFALHVDETAEAPGPDEITRLDEAGNRAANPGTAAFTVLLDILEGMDAQAGPGALIERILAGLLKALSGERALLFEYDVKRSKPKQVLDYPRGCSAARPISESLIQRAASERRPCLMTDTVREGGPDMPSLQRLVDGHVHSIVVVPLVRQRRLAGILYVDSPAARRAFGRADLEMLERAATYLGGLVEAAREHAHLAEDNQKLRAAIAGDRDENLLLDRLHAPDSPMAKVVALAQRAARRSVTVLLTGETGTGKELTARFIHAHSERRAARFIAINCGALPEALVESELFGYRQGAFSGAQEDRAGLIELADGGTLFLDEVGELPPSAQVKLLRVLEERRVQRLGAAEPVAVDFRLVAATHRNLEEDVQLGKFRQDLFYRLNVFPVTLAPLRERLMDLPLLLDHLLEVLGLRLDSPIRKVSSEALDVLKSYDWPGNLRELRNVLERALVLEDGLELSVASLPVEISAGPGQTGSPQATGPVRPFAEELAEFELAYLRRLYEMVGNNISAMARTSGISRLTIQRRMRALREKISTRGSSCGTSGSSPGRG